MGSSRHILFTLVLLAAFGLPYVLMHDSLFQSARSSWETLWRRSPNPATAAATPISVQSAKSSPSGDKQASAAGGARPNSQIEQTVNRLREIAARTAPKDSPAMSDLVGPTVNHPAELFRFDVAPEWVGTNWSRVTNLPVSQGLETYRVPVMSGTAPHDVSGSMSYCFDGSRQVQRVVFSGTTHSPGPLLDVLTRHYGLQPQPSVGGRLYASQEGGKIRNAVFVKLMSRGGARDPLPVYHVDVELNRPGHSYGASDWLEQLIREHVVTAAPPVAAETENSAPAPPAQAPKGPAK